MPTCDPLKYIMANNILIVYICMGISIRILRVNQVQTAFDISGHGELDRWSRMRVIISQQCLRLNLNFLKLATYHTRMAKLLFMYRFNSFFASGDFWRLLIAFANSIGSRSGPTEHQSWYGSKQFDTLIVFLKEIFEKIINFEKVNRQQKQEKLPSMQRVNLWIKYTKFLTLCMLVCLLITIANSLDPDQEQQNGVPDLDQNVWCTLWRYS